MVDDEVIPIQLDTEMSQALISLDGHDVIIWADSYLVRVRGSEVTASDAYVGVSPQALSTRGGRIASIVHVSDEVGLGSGGMYAVEYDDNLRLKVAAVVPP